jgi:mono/diheme cytochrome c family protein
VNQFRSWIAFLFLTAGTAIFAQNDTKATYVSKCQPCHGATGAGDTPMGKKQGVVAFGAEEVVKSSDGLLLATIRNGKGQMPPWGNKLSEAQMKDLVVYVRSLSGK